MPSMGSFLPAATRSTMRAAAFGLSRMMVRILRFNRCRSRRASQNHYRNQRQNQTHDARSDHCWGAPAVIQASHFWYVGLAVPAVKTMPPVCGVVSVGELIGFSSSGDIAGVVVLISLMTAV